MPYLKMLLRACIWPIRAPRFLPRPGIPLPPTYGSSPSSLHSPQLLTLLHVRPFSLHPPAALLSSRKSSDAWTRPISDKSLDVVSGISICPICSVFPPWSCHESVALAGVALRGRDKLR